MVDATDDILKIILNVLDSRNISQIKNIFENLKDKDYFTINFVESHSSRKKQIENVYYKTLTRYLKERKFQNFRELTNYASDLDIFLDVKKISHRFEILTNLHLMSLQIGQLGQMIEYVRFFNEFQLLERRFSAKDLEIIKSLKKDTLFLANLKDLFNIVSDPLIYYVHNIMPRDLFQFFMDYFRSPLSLDEDIFSERGYNLKFILKYLDNYLIYGLRVQKLSTIPEFMNKIEKEHEIINDSSVSNNPVELNFIKVKFKNRLHLVSPANIRKVKKKAQNPKNYNFYSFSMVILGGLGPQGHGFTYSTPRGEIIEVCSDIKEHEAIIIKYKQFLKRQFLKKFEVEMKHLSIPVDIIEDITNYLSKLLDNDELIDYFKRGEILNKIQQFLNKKQQKATDDNDTIEKLMEKISDAISLITRDIKLQDQFKTRMNLVMEDKIKSEDIAKLTSLKGKSHYDVLRERFFFQNIVKWFYEFYLREVRSTPEYYK